MGNGERPQFLPTRAPPQDFYSQADRERTTNSSARCVSPPLYPSGTCKQAPVLRSLPFSQHFKLLLLHRLFPLFLETLSERSASPLPIRSTRVVSSYSSNSPPSLRLRSKSCSHYSSNSSMARLTRGSLAWVDESTCDGDYARVRLSSNLYPISSTGLLVITRSFIRIYSIRADFLVMSSSCAVSGSVTIPWQPTATPCL